MSGGYEIALTEDIAACQRLRRVVFIEEQGVSEADEVDGLDGTAQHLLACREGVPVGSARLLAKGTALKIGRVCVLAEDRGQGLGEALIAKALEIGAAQGFERAVLGSQTHAIGFYARLGFEAYGPVYDDAGLPHQDMAKALR